MRRHCHPYALIIYATSLLVALMTLPALGLLISIIIFASIFAFSGKVREWADMTTPISKLALFYFIVSLIFSSSVATDPLLFSITVQEIEIVRVNDFTLFLCLSNALRLVVVYSVFFFIASEIDRDFFLEETARYAPSLALGVSISFLMVPRFFERVRRLKNELALRGYCISLRTPLVAVHKLLPLVIALTYEALDEAWSLSELLYARGYGVGPRTKLRSLRKHRISWEVIPAMLLALAAYFASGPTMTIVYLALSLLVYHAPRLFPRELPS